MIALRSVMCNAIPVIRGLMAPLRKALVAGRRARQGIPASGIKLSQLHLEGIVQSAMDAIITIDDTFAIVMFNPAAEQMFGYAARDIIGCPLSQLLPQRFHATHGRQMSDFSASGSVARRMGNLGSVAACRADGTEFAAEASISHFAVDARVHYTAIVRDVTERTRMLADLQTSEQRERLRASEIDNILFAVPAAVCIAHDTALEDITENDLYKKWFRAAGHAGQDPPSPTARPFRDVLREAAAGHEVRNYQCADLKADGSVRHLLGNAITVWNDDRVPAGAICAFVDVTNLKMSELEVLSVTETSTAKSDYITQMTHELRTPLGTMLGYAQLLETATPSLHPDHLRALRQILKAGWHVRELINEVQQLSTIEAHALHLPAERVDLATLLADMQAMIVPLLVEKHISATFSTGGRIVVSASPQHCKQVLLNLLSNAIKYNRHGGAIFVSGDSCEPGKARVTVRDTGDGLDAAQLASLFQPFNRLGQETGREVGTGVGLIVTKRLVEAMGGTIGVESARGVGTSFWVSLPLAAPH